MTSPSVSHPVPQTDFTSFYGVDFVLKSGQKTTCFFATMEEQQAVIGAVYFWKAVELEPRPKRREDFNFGVLAPDAYSEQSLPLFSAWLPIKDGEGRKYITGAVIDFREVAAAGIHVLGAIERKEDGGAA